MGQVDSALQDIYRRLLDEYGPQRWWPAESPFEVMVGAILTQSAAWANVEKAIGNLRRAGLLSPRGIHNQSLDELAPLVRPSGYYNAKAKKLKAMVEWLGKHSDNLDKAFSGDTAELRSELLAVHGIGPETADSILLYAALKPVFVIDAYTRRILSRLGLASPEDTYDDLQRLFMANLEADVQIFNEYHALLVRLGKEACRKAPLCSQCCLAEICRSQKGA